MFPGATGVAFDDPGRDNVHGGRRFRRGRSGIDHGHHGRTRALDGVVLMVRVVGGCAAGGGGAARPTAESLASTVRPGKELSTRRTVVTGGELIGASSGSDWRGDSPMGAP